MNRLFPHSEQSITTHDGSAEMERMRCRVGYRLVTAHVAQLPRLVTMANECGIAMLHYPAAKGDQKLIQTLFDAGADKSAKNPLGDTPKEDVVLIGHPEVVVDLL